MRLGTCIDTKHFLDLDLDTLVATRLLVTATSGGGKSFVLRRILEQTHGDIQQIILDPEGEFPSLRERFDYVLAGRGGDVEARPETAAKLAEHLLELQVSAVCDLYELKALERKRFMRLFLEAMINAPKRLWHPVLVVIDEAHTYAPEKGQAESASAVNDLCTRGRKRGFCAVLATQRVSNLDKQATAQCTNVMVGPTFQDLDRRRSVEILGADSLAAERGLRTGLMGLKPGEFWCMGRAFSEQQRTLVRVGGVKTRHPEIAGGRKAMPGPPPPSAKVKAILAKIEDIPREAEEEATELVRLRTRVRDLDAELRQRPVEQVGITEQELHEREVAWEQALTDVQEERDELSQSVEEITAAFHEMGDLDDLAKAGNRMLRAINGARSPDQLSRVEIPVVKARPTPAPRRAHLAPDVAPVLGGDYCPRAGCRRMLVALARYPGTMTVSQLRTMARLKKSGTSGAYLGELIRNGLVEKNGNEVTITETGLVMVGEAARIPMTPAETLEAWRDEFRAGTRRMLDALVDDDGSGMSRAELGNAAELEPSSGTFGAYLGELRRNGLAVESGGLIRLAEFLR
ncbi:MAG TPA: DUF87 domain-containing protein [Anaerolineae bacterium]|nr:DUF87 domain-containing protein [Anaerolineae bacterium]